MKKLLLFICFCLAVITSHAQLFSNVLVSDVGSGNNIGSANTDRNVGVDGAGNIYVVFEGSLGIRVAKSTNRGSSFSPSVQIAATNFRWRLYIGRRYRK